MNPSKTPRLRMFAGPNGSGKSTIKDAVPEYLLGIYLNADDIEKQIKLTAQFDLSPYRANQEVALAFFRQSSFLAKSNLLNQIDLIQVVNQILCFSQLDINSYIASVLVDFLRHHLLAKRLSFTFETVMSHQSKVDFLQEAQQQGFRTYLYFVATVDPDINISRVAYRVQTGGHPVPSEKIIKRYYRSINLLMDAITHSDRAYIFDNSADDDSVLLAEITDGDELELKVDAVPLWFQTAILDKF
jgi:predicted ABC-type ATPase